MERLSTRSVAVVSEEGVNKRKSVEFTRFNQSINRSPFGRVYGHGVGCYVLRYGVRGSASVPVKSSRFCSLTFFVFLFLDYWTSFDTKNKTPIEEDIPVPNERMLTR